MAEGDINGTDWVGEVLLLPREGPCSFMSQKNCFLTCCKDKEGRHLGSRRCRSYFLVEVVRNLEGKGGEGKGGHSCCPPPPLRPAF